MKFTSNPNTSFYMYLCLLFQNQGPHFLLLPLFRKIYPPFGQDQENVRCTFPMYLPSSSIYCPLNKSLLQVFVHPPGRRKLHIPPGSIKCIPRNRKETKTYEKVEKMTKIKIERVFIKVENSILFVRFTFFIFVLLCHNSDSNMLNCEGFLSKLLKFSLRIIVCPSNYMKDKTLFYPFFNHCANHMPN